MEVVRLSVGVAGGSLPAQRIDSAGRVHIDQRAVLALALPLMADSAVQIALTLTDAWFIGHISTRALAAVGAAQWLIGVVLCVLGGVAIAVQTIVAQSHGARRYRRAAHATWNALWATLCATPILMAMGVSSQFILSPFGFDPRIQRLASEFWLPRVSGASLGAAALAMLSFFNGIGRPRVTVLISIATVIANIIFNQLFIFRLGWGIAGSGWATNIAQACGLLLAMSVFLSAAYRNTYGSHLTWRPHAGRLIAQLGLGLPMGLLAAGDLLGLSLFQMMQVRLGAAGGAATLIVLMLMSVSYMPGFGIASAGTTLVGKSIGAGDREWALHVGTRVIILATLYMGGIGLFLAFMGPWILPLFMGSVDDADTVAAVTLGTHLLWLASGYQVFDGLNLGSGSCLRGAGDAIVPAALVLPVSWFVFVPLAHSFTFAPGQGWVNFLPQFGWGAIGGWVALLIYVVLLGSMMLVRWRSRAWQKIRI